jgi:membrane protease YdiL (CAAX protease family)
MVLLLGPFTIWYLICGILTCALVYVLGPAKEDATRSLYALCFFCWWFALVLMLYGFLLGLYESVRKRNK